MNGKKWVFGKISKNNKKIVSTSFELKKKYLSSRNKCGPERVNAISMFFLNLGILFAKILNLINWD